MGTSSENGLQWPVMQLRQRPRRHYVWTKDGQDIVIPFSVTQIANGVDTGDGLIQWNINNTLAYLECKPEAVALGYHLGTPGDMDGARYHHRNVLNGYGLFGTQVHSLIESEITGEVHGYQVVGERAERCLEAWRSWWAGQDVAEIVGVEKTVVCMDPHPYAGTFDLLFRDSLGRYHLADWKTSKTLRPKYHVQLGAYARALRIEHGIDVYQAHLVRLDGDACAYQVHVLKHLNRLGELFAVELTNLNNYQNLEKHIKEHMKK
jgi:hypothetical protein